jgi:hypothetical protein
MMKTRWQVAVLAALSMGGVCGPGPGLPMPDSCADGARAGTVTSLEIGGGGDPFAPQADGDVTPKVIGAQGGAMVVVRVRLRGPDVPDCLAQRTIVYAGGGAELAEEPEALLTYAQPDGSRTTNALYVRMFGMIPQGGQPVIVRVIVGALEVTRVLWIDAVGTGALPTIPDAGALD